METKRASFLFCKNGSEMTVRLPKKSFLSSVTSFFTSKDKITQMYDIESIDLSVAFLLNSTKYNSSEIQLFDRKSLRMCGKFTVEWLENAIKSYISLNQTLKVKLNVGFDIEIIYITGKFYRYKQQRHLILTFRNGVRAHLYIAPTRS